MFKVKSLFNGIVVDSETHASFNLQKEMILTVIPDPTTLLKKESGCILYHKNLRIGTYTVDPRNIPSHFKEC